MNCNKITIIILTFFILGCTREYEEKDLYVDKLVYLKSDSTLFTGTLKVADNASYYYQAFCKGIPCGEWAERENGGGLVQKGKYLNKNILSRTTKDLIETDTFLINHWQESELPTVLYPQFLTVLILKEDVFFEGDKSKYEGYISELANAVMNDTRSLKYDYLKIRFVNAVHDWSKEYWKEYKIEGRKLVETGKE